MRVMTIPKSLLLLALLAAVVLPNAGCPPAPNPNAVLAGTWTLAETTSPNPNLTQVLLNFDSAGSLVSVSYVFNGGAQVTRTLTNSTTSVSGSDVTITTNNTGVFALNFTGTLNADDTVITGNASWSLTIGATTITAPTGPATLTKGVSITGNATAGQTLFNATCLPCHNAPPLVEASSEIVPDLGSISSIMSSITLTAKRWPTCRRTWAR